MGLASYLLIGFWYKKKSANDAAIKAFVTNRVGDFGFALGIMAIFLVFGSVAFDDVFAQVGDQADAVLSFAGMSFNAIELIAFLLFIGAMGKSAQFFLHVWLPDAMEGPTPVSALIHAATMVTGGGLPRLPGLPDLRDGAERLGHCHRDRCRDGAVRGDGRHGAERHQAGCRLFDLFAAGLHVLRRGPGPLWRGHGSTCSRTPSSRRSCSSAPAR